MRIDVTLCLACAALAACGAEPQRGILRRSVADCASYQVAMRPPLGRMSRAADHFSEAAQLGPEGGADALEELSVSLSREREELEGLLVADPKIAAVHDRMVSALGEMCSALSWVANVLGRREEARRMAARERLRVAVFRWEKAVEGVRRVCPID